MKGTGLNFEISADSVYGANPEIEKEFAVH